MNRWVATPGNKCRGCYTTKYVYYCFTDHKGNTWESCESCLDKVRKMRDNQESIKDDYRYYKNLGF